jgi:hypothetical protein
MKQLLKIAGGWVASFVVGFYITFVLQTLWNWFVTTALRVDSISYWNMYGLFLIAAAATRNGSSGSPLCSCLKRAYPKRSGRQPCV